MDRDSVLREETVLQVGVFSVSNPNSTKSVKTGTTCEALIVAFMEMVIVESLYFFMFLPGSPFL